MLKIYDWENKTFPEQQAILIDGEKRIPLAMEILKAYKLNNVRVTLSTNGRGLARQFGYGYEICLPRPNRKCSLGLIIHEITHVMAKDWCANVMGYEEEGHRKGFKKCLIKLMVEVMRDYPKYIAIVNGVIEKNRRLYQEAVEKEVKKAQKTADKKAYRKTTAYRIEKVTRRIIKLERKIKNLNSRLKSAKRSLSALQRAEAKKNFKLALKDAENCSSEELEAADTILKMGGQ